MPEADLADDCLTCVTDCIMCVDDSLIHVDDCLIYEDDYLFVCGSGRDCLKYSCRAGPPGHGQVPEDDPADDCLICVADCLTRVDGSLVCVDACLI